jgi:hypothetical protein
MSHPVATAPRNRKPLSSGEPSWLARSLADKTTLLRLSVLANIALVMWAFVQPVLLLQQLHAPQRAILLDGAGSYSISPLLDLNSATPLQHAAAQDAAYAMLMRGPAQLDRPTQVDLWFTKIGREKVDTLVKSETAEFETKQFHQKATIEETGSIATGDGQFTAKVSGQLIRTGVLNGRVHVETKLFELQLQMIRNPDMLTNKRYPFAAWNFDLQYSR